MEREGGAFLQRDSDGEGGQRVARTAARHPEAPVSSSGDEQADVQRLREMVEQNDVEGARAFVKDLEQWWPDSERVRYWARVLAPPVVRVVKGQRGRSLEKERAWLKEHAREYPGCWLAVFEDRLIAADPDFGVVLAVVRETPGAESALFSYQFAPESAT